MCNFIRIAKLSPNDRNLTLKIKPEKGKLLLFPSTLFHETEILQETMIRYSISFNTFISGHLPEVRSGLRLKMESAPIETAKRRFY